MVQGHKQKIVSKDEEIITDLDAGKIYFVTPKTKQYVEIAFPPRGMFADKMATYRYVVKFKKAASTEKVAGQTCQDYAGATVAGPFILRAIECASSDAPGAREFTEFQKAMAEKLKGKPGPYVGGPPEGISLVESSTKTTFPFRPPPGFSPEVAAKIQARMAQNKPIVHTVTVSRIEQKDLSADIFAVPADYNKSAAPPVPHVVTKDGKPVMPPFAPAGQGPSAKPAASAAPAAAASH